MKTKQEHNRSKARIYFPDGHVEDFHDEILAFGVWLGLPIDVRAAFRGANDLRPVYPWDYVNTP